MGEELKQTYTVRILEQAATRIEEVARTHRITPTTIIQALIIRKFKLREGGDRETDILAEAEVAAKLETLRKSFEALERARPRDLISSGSRSSRLAQPSCIPSIRPLRQRGRPDHRSVGSERA